MKLLQKIFTNCKSEMWRNEHEIRHFSYELQQDLNFDSQY